MFVWFHKFVSEFRVRTNLGSIRLRSLFQNFFGVCLVSLIFYRILSEYKLWLRSTSGSIKDSSVFVFTFKNFFPSFGFIQILALFNFWVCYRISSVFVRFLKIFPELWVRSKISFVFVWFPEFELVFYVIYLTRDINVCYCNECYIFHVFFS